MHGTEMEIQGASQGKEAQKKTGMSLVGTELSISADMGWGLMSVVTGGVPVGPLFLTAAEFEKVKGKLRYDLCQETRMWNVGVSGTGGDFSKASRKCLRKPGQALSGLIRMISARFTVHY